MDDQMNVVFEDGVVSSDALTGERPDGRAAFQKRMWVEGREATMTALIQNRRLEQLAMVLPLVTGKAVAA